MYVASALARDLKCEITLADVQLEAVVLVGEIAIELYCRAGDQEDKGV